MSWERKPQADPSWISRPLECLTRLVVRFPRSVLLLGGIAAVISVWLAMTQLGFRTSRANLMNPNSDYNRRWLKYTEEFGDKEDVVVVVEGESREQIVPALDDACRELGKHKNLFGAVLHQTDAPKLRSKGLYYLDVKSNDPREIDLEKIDELLDQAAPILQGDWSQLSLGNMAKWMSAAMSSGSDAQRGQILAAVQTELPRAAKGLEAALRHPGSYKSPWPEMPLSSALAAKSASTRLISEDGRTGFILLRFLEADNQSFTQNDGSVKILRELAADVQSRHAGTKVGLTGLPIIEHDEMQSSEKSMSLATFLSFAGVMAVMIIAFGGCRHAVLPMAALCVAMVWACGCVTLLIGYVNVLSIAFASILFGMGIDYGIYYVARYLQVRERTTSTSEALARTTALVGPGILTGALTSTISFLAAGLTDFPGVSQLGIMAGCGILLCWLGEATLLPAAIRLTDKDGNRAGCLPEPLDLRFWLKPLYAFPRLSLVGAVVLTVLMGVGLCYLRYDYNLLNLQPEGLESVDLEHKLFNQTSRSAWFALSTADTPQQVIERKKQFLALPSVERVEEIVSKLPSDCQRKQQIIERIHQRLANLPQEVPQIPVTPLTQLDQMLAGAQAMLLSMPQASQITESLRQMREMLRSVPPAEYERLVREYQQAGAKDMLRRLQMFQAASMPELPQESDLPESVVARFVGSKHHRYLLQVYSKANIWEVGPMGQFIREVRSVDPEATGNPFQVYEASHEMKRSFEQASWYALLVIAPVVLFDFRRLNHGMLAALPMGLGLLQTLGFMGLFDIPLSPANMIVLPLMLGLGMDTGINLIHEMRCQGRHYRGAGNAVLVAVVVNSLTTMVGFGALMIANHRGLQSLGRVLTIAMGFSILNSLLLPNLLILGGFAREDADEDDADDESDEDADYGDECDDYDEDAEDDQVQVVEPHLAAAA
jgi:uncharacterized protein